MREGVATIDGDSAGADRVVVHSRGATSVVESVLGRDVVAAIADAPGVRRAADGTPYRAASAFVSVDAIRRNGKRGSVLAGRCHTRCGARGAGPSDTRRSRLPAGGARADRVGSDPQDLQRAGGRQPHHACAASNGRSSAFSQGRDSLNDSVLRADAETVMSAFGRNTFQQINVRLESPARLPHIRGCARAQSGDFSRCENTGGEPQRRLQRSRAPAEFRGMVHRRRDGGGRGLRCS